MHNVQAKGILSASNGMNIYRGCLHGCIYCDSRSKCYNMQHDFEDIEVKVNAPELLDLALRHKRHKCMICTGSMSDPYTPPEQKLMLTRKVLETIEKHGFGLSVLTKSDLILRDLDLLKSINSSAKCVVMMTMTTYDDDLCSIIEPGVCTTSRRFEVLTAMKEAGIPTVVWISPILPFINDTPGNINGLLDYCIKAGVYGIVTFGPGVTMREGDREYFYEKLDRHFPGIKQKYIRKYGMSYELISDRGDELMDILTTRCRDNSIVCSSQKVFDYIRTFEEKTGGEQLSFF
ncbi:MAG: radical SAM protein [Oscillospiraceae bacterium]|nr:radical SAM protein [Oscillospiraceae bacterium]